MSVTIFGSHILKSKTTVRKAPGQKTALRLSRPTRAKSKRVSVHYEVGSAFDASRLRWPELTVYAYNAGAHELRLFRQAPDAALTKAVQSGRAEFRFSPQGAVALLLFRFAGQTEWQFAAVSWWLLSRDDAGALSADSMTAPLRVVLVDSLTGKVTAACLIEWEAAVRLAFNQALRGQSEQSGQLAQVSADLRSVSVWTPEETARCVAA